jgi:hypothetical protein
MEPSRLRDPQLFIEAFGHRAAFQIATIDRKQTADGRTWNSLLVDLFRASTAHCQYLLVKNWASLILHDPILHSKPALRKAMKDCFELFGELPRMSLYGTFAHLLLSVPYDGTELFGFHIQRLLCP